MTENYEYLVELLAEKIKLRDGAYNPHLEDEIKELKRRMRIDIFGHEVPWN